VIMANAALARATCVMRSKPRWSFPCCFMLISSPRMWPLLPCGAGGARRLGGVATAYRIFRGLRGV
jgi:hypothetical protein